MKKKILILGIVSCVVSSDAMDGDYKIKSYGSGDVASEAISLPPSNVSSEQKAVSENSDYEINSYGSDELASEAVSQPPSNVSSEQGAVSEVTADDGNAPDVSGLKAHLSTIHTLRKKIETQEKDVAKILKNEGNLGESDKSKLLNEITALYMEIVEMEENVSKLLKKISNDTEDVDERLDAVDKVESLYKSIEKKESQIVRLSSGLK
jgi:uncharacterized phage infection (PIP) family protein YhgE